MLKRYIIYIFISILLFQPSCSFAFGKTGHEIVAEIALYNLSKQAKDDVQNYLGNMSFEDAGTWMDQMRSDSKYDFMKPWHYIDFPKGQPYTPTTDENAVNQLIITLREVSHKQTLCSDQVKKDILVLFHLIGDLHQPLHTGYASDKGGNDIKVTFLSTPSNLHRVWDTDIIEQQNISLKDCLQLYATLSASDIAKIKVIDPVAWMKESRTYLDSVYDFSGNEIDKNYCQKNRSLLVKQLLYAGIRLSAVLEQYFGGVSQATANQTDTIVIAGKTITAEDAAKHIGEDAMVCGKVYGGKFLDRSNGTPTLINMGAAYPNSPFTLVIFGSDRNHFSYIPEEYLNGKTICVSGKIKEYNGKPEIIVSKESQIKISK